MEVSSSSIIIRNGINNSIKAEKALNKQQPISGDVSFIRRVLYHFAKSENVEGKSFIFKIFYTHTHAKRDIQPFCYFTSSLSLSSVFLFFFYFFYLAGFSSSFFLRKIRQTGRIMHYKLFLVFGIFIFSSMVINTVQSSSRMTSFALKRVNVRVIYAFHNIYPFRIVCGCFALADANNE